MICFEGFGPQSSLTRFKEQAQLLGSNIILCENRDIHVIYNQINSTIAKKSYSSKPQKNQNASLKIVKYIMESHQ